MGHTKSFSVAPVDDDFEFDESYFRQFYKPLSNLPTPPPSTRTSSANQSPRVSFDDTEGPNSQFLGPAAHLARMLPPGASFITPSIPTVQQMLARANLPMDIIALAVCILDSLDSKFSRSWRVAFPLNRQGQPASKRHTLPSAPGQATHINSVFPEIIILAALVIADKFVEDMQSPTQYFVSTWGEQALDLRAGTTSRWRDGRLSRRRAAAAAAAARGGVVGEDGRQKHFKSMSSGHAVVGLGLQLTPAATPDSERVAAFDEI
ncbi:hypothetical protein CIB48_g8953 [Xylaria polymorpha]|nr:hypothetical protein CIB48_g8953 [Xylaria polymorpha]